MDHPIIIGETDGETARSAPVQITPADKRRTSRYLTKFEIAKVIGWRATQIAAGQRSDSGLKRDEAPLSFLGSSMGAQRAPPSPRAIYEGLAENRLPTSLADGDAKKKGGKKAGKKRGRDAKDGAAAAAFDHFDPVALAKQELLHGTLPCVVRRVFPDGRRFEDIPVRELRVDHAWVDFDGAPLPPVFAA